MLIIGQNNRMVRDPDFISIERTFPVDTYRTAEGNELIPEAEIYTVSATKNNHSKAMGFFRSREAAERVYESIKNAALTGQDHFVI